MSVYPFLGRTKNTTKHGQAPKSYIVQCFPVFLSFCICASTVSKHEACLERNGGGGMVVRALNTLTFSLLHLLLRLCFILSHS